MSFQLLLVGSGNMGSAMLKGWVEKKLSLKTITVIEPNIAKAESIKDNYNVTTLNSASELALDFMPEVIIFAIKPQIMDAVICSYKKHVTSETLIISIAAGKNLAYLENNLSEKTSIIRAMPNTPAAVNRAITVACSNANVKEIHYGYFNDLFKIIGLVEWINDESFIDVITALSGGGPAYVCLLVEYLATAGKNAGLPEDLAMRLSRATVSGAGELLHQSVENVTTLRSNVTSPGGTTEAALKVLMSDNVLQSKFDKAISSAASRSRQLAKI